VIYYYGPVQCVAEQDFPHHSDVFWSGESIDGVFLGIGLGKAFFYLYHTFRNGIFFVVGISWFGPDLFLPPWVLCAIFFLSYPVFS